MHDDCFKSFLSSLENRLHINTNVDRLEFFCPVCRRLSNALIPFVPPKVSQALEEAQGQYPIPSQLTEWVAGLPALYEWKDIPLPSNVDLNATDRLVQNLATGVLCAETDMLVGKLSHPIDPKEAQESLGNSLIANCRIAELLSRHDDSLNEILKKRNTLRLLTPCSSIRGLYGGKRQILIPLLNSLLGKSCVSPSIQIAEVTHLPMLSIDPFDFLVRFSTVWPTGPSQVFSQAVKLSFVVSVLQAFVWLHKNASLQLCRSTPSPSHPLVRLYSAVIRRVDPESDYLSKVSIEDLEAATLNLCQPFLWQSAFWQIVLRSEGEEPLPPRNPTALLDLLQLPSLSSLPDLGLDAMIEGWLDQWKPLKDKSRIPLVGFPRPTQLLELPPTFQDIVLRFVGVKCSHCKKVPQQIAVCLICGTMCCVATDCCTVNRRGECSRHSETCGGIFLMLKSTFLLLLRDERRAVWGTIYFDERGEEDPGIRRGRSLFLDKSRYALLRRLWLSCSFDHESAIIENTARDGHFM